MLYSDDLIMIVNLLQENSLLNFFRLRTTDPIQDFEPLRRKRAYAMNMNVVITYIRIRVNNKILIMINIICDAKIFEVEKN